MYIAVDFDGTCVTHDYPEVGKDIGAAPVLRALRERGHHIMALGREGGGCLKGSPADSRSSLKWASGLS